ncbi:shikimate kinase [Gordonia sp. CPCC 205333]|uniref:shikimate kinase n=1 Tax=Gordonia sp. CPCC 205333 TaxID=3140790 RepID=UPI003AF39AC7
MTPVVVLTGFMGSGKSTVGQELSRSLGVEFVDTDLELEHRAGRTIAEIFADDGEKQFRTLELETVRDVLADSGGIVSLGGGSVTVPAIRDALVGHHVVYLEISADDGFARVAGTDRPLLAAADPAKRYAELLDARRDIYRAVATHTVDATDAVERLVATIIDALPDSGGYAATTGEQA